jgi:hypothetical protein
VTILPSNRDALPLADDQPSGGPGAHWLRVAGVVAGVAAVLFLARSAVLPAFVSSPAPAPVAPAAPAAPDAEPLSPPPLLPSHEPDQGGAPSDAVAPPSPAPAGGAEEELDLGARVEVGRLPDGSFAVRVREASPGTQVWLPGGVRLLIAEGDQVRLLEPVPDGVLSPEHAR